LKSQRRSSQIEVRLEALAFPLVRLRRARNTPAIREILREVRLEVQDLVYPIFVDESALTPVPIRSMAGQNRLSLSGVAMEVKRAVQLGIKAMLVFGIPTKKDEEGSSALAEDGVAQRTVRSIKDEAGDRVVAITDVCLCEYTTHGHCGILEEGRVLNDQTLNVLGKIAVSHAEAGADMVAPSAMMDGQVKAIREALDDAGFKDTGIMAYSAKHASCLYGPFREAAESKPQFGDRKTYQMDYGNPNQAMREVEMDIREGADIIMIKPALAYLDIIYRVKTRFGVPTAAYNVSGEYAMVKAAAEKGWIDEKEAVLEILTAIKRAGADLIITYHAKEVAEWLK